MSIIDNNFYKIKITDEFAGLVTSTLDNLNKSGDIIEACNGLRSILENKPIPFIQSKELKARLMRIQEVVQEGADEYIPPVGFEAKIVPNGELYTREGTQFYKIHRITETDRIDLTNLFNLVIKNCIQEKLENLKTTTTHPDKKRALEDSDQASSSSQININKIAHREVDETADPAVPLDALMPVIIHLWENDQNFVNLIKDNSGIQTLEDLDEIINFVIDYMVIDADFKAIMIDAYELLSKPV